MNKILLGILVFLGINGQAYSNEISQLPPKRIRVIALTDFHGALEPQAETTKLGLKVESGGAALLSTYIHVLRNKDPIPTILLDAGDLFQGTLVSNSAEGRPVIQFYNYLGVDAVALGNHEFDYGPAGPKSLPKSPLDDPRGALRDRIREAHFPFLAANVFTEKGVRPSWLRPSILIKKQGIKIGIIGFAGKDTPDTTNRKNLVGLQFEDPVQHIIRQSKSLKALGASFVIVVGHSGGGCSDNSPEQWKNLASCETGELFRILKELPPQTVDLAIGGHTHKGIAKEVNGIPVLQPYSNSRFLGTIVLTKEGENKALEAGSLIEVCATAVRIGDKLTCSSFDVKASTSPIENVQFLGEIVRPDPIVSQRLQPDFDRVKDIKDAPLNIILKAGFKRAYGQENELGNFLGDVLLAHAKNADVVVLNNGGLRANLDPKPLTYDDIFSVLPFDNLVALIKVDGRTLLQMLELAISSKGGGFSWSGLTFLSDQCKPMNVEINSVPLEPNKIYSILTTDYISTGAGIFEPLHLNESQIELLDPEITLRDATILAMKAYRKSLDPADYFAPDKKRQKFIHPCNSTSIR